MMCFLQNLTESIEEYQYWLSVYNYGAMDALCDTLTQLRNVMQLALNSVCPSRHHPLVVNTATTAATTATTAAAAAAASTLQAIVRET